jgi:hypothetical protein
VWRDLSVNGVIPTARSHRSRPPPTCITQDSGKQAADAATETPQSPIERITLAADFFRQGYSEYGESDFKLCPKPTGHSFVPKGYNWIDP